MTAENFFQFLACGKEVFLSSLAAMEPKYSNLCLFEDLSVFKTPEWAEYKRAVQEADASPDRCLPPKQDNQVGNRFLLQLQQRMSSTAVKDSELTHILVRGPQYSSALFWSLSRHLLESPFNLCLGLDAQDNQTQIGTFRLSAGVSNVHAFPPLLFRSSFYLSVEHSF